MAIKLRRGLESERTTVLFQQGEIVYATDSKKVYIGDGLTLGGNLVTGEELLSALDDVVLTSLANGNLLIYDSTLQKWKNIAPTTTNITEGTNLYFTDTRVYTKVKAALIAGSNTSITFDDALQTITIASQGNVQSVNTKTGAVVLDTDDIGEGVTNLYYTDTRFDDRLATKTTDDLTEGTNEYYTDAKVDAVLVAESVTKQGNTFNGAEQLVQLDATAKLPAIDGSNLTNLPIPPSTGGNLYLFYNY